MPAGGVESAALDSASLATRAAAPAALIATVLAITLLYVLSAEHTKHWFYRVCGNF